MKILISNDDGYLAPGILCLADVLGKNAETLVIAPDRNRSGASNSLTLEYPIRAKSAPNGFYYVDGTPTDCVHLAITGLMDSAPDIVVSGINAGPNMGDDVHYSGTVAAAMEGRSLGLPALAVSLAGNNKQDLQYYATAAHAVEILIQRLQAKKLDLPDDTILNINVPDLPWEQIAGMQITRLGKRHRSSPVIKSQDPRGQAIYWIGAAGSVRDAGEGTDFHAVKHGFVSITPLHVDLTRYSALDTMSNWLGSF
ncbi:MAG: 5'/3'-nucleotidase SurE [Thiotrichaceae bacterium]|nr:5'/3'-nucleotidase SurE [Thiotrichaceae bacterium]